MTNLATALSFEVISDPADYPYALFLLADETKAAIDRYITASRVYQVRLDQQIVAAFCLYTVDAAQLELKNIAVAEAFRNRGIGSQIIHYIKRSFRQDYDYLLVGTAAIGWDQIRFYERHGFKKYAIRSNFFITNYPKPIIENGQTLKDMLVLRLAF